MPKFNLKSSFKPAGDQPQAIEALVKNIKAGATNQILLGVTGSGKTFTIANVIERIQKPTLVISHNKALAAQLYQEFKEFFPKNAVEFFVSYYDYYQPEAYIPASDTYIEKDAKINDVIDMLRHSATASLLTRPDTIIIASVSCIYGIGDPGEYEKASFEIGLGQKIKRQEFLRTLALLQYNRSDYEPLPGTFSVKGGLVQVRLPSGKEAIKIEFFGDEIEKMELVKNILESDGQELKNFHIFPAKHFVTPKNKLELAIKNIEKELQDRLQELKSQEKLVEAERLLRRTTYDMELLRTTGYASGIENYSQHLSFRQPGDPPFTLIDYFNHAYKDWLCVIDESHQTVPQIRGMYEGDRSRKKVLVEYGFRLPSAIDNRPLKFNEFEDRVKTRVYATATVGPYELQKSGGAIVEQLVRPTGLLDPRIEVRPAKNQVKNLIEEIKNRIEKKERVLVTTLTKRLAEDLADYLVKAGIKTHWLHAEVKTFERTDILKDLRTGQVDVIVGINLLREGLDLPEVSLVAILDADKEGFLRNETTLIQTIGRAARHAQGKAIFYADKITGSMRRAMEETDRRRVIQEEYNSKHGITPQQITKAIRESFLKKAKDEPEPSFKQMSIEAMTQQMLDYAKKLEFEKAAYLRDQIEKAKLKK